MAHQFRGNVDGRCALCLLPKTDRFHDICVGDLVAIKGTDVYGVVTAVKGMQDPRVHLSRAQTLFEVTWPDATVNTRWTDELSKR